MVIAELTKRVAELIKNSSDAEIEAEYIVMSAMGADRTEYTLNRLCKASEEAENAAFMMAKRRRSGEPLAYILKSAEFMGLKFNVTPATLIPRADTETLAELAIDKIGDTKVKVLDIGTGTGCVGISIARFCKNADVTLLDISANALMVAAKNADINGVSVKILQCDILSKMPESKFDVIVSNPPYIRADVIPTLQTEVKDCEPHLALDGGKDGLMFYRRIAEISQNLLNKDGLLAFEIGYDQRDDVLKIMNSYNNLKCIKDLCGNDRVVYGRK